ncbi:hypothetical protein [Advenella mimigardefordensis]|uniref:Excinuclease ATPase subunit n=1 Tax=Advenella mimigardefordensis (strain DSM 17166 / LMG 22922 / DPN7) TaxID=1247726 RepID=W0PKJ9_ADVMD|nr:hypothetical protein [Advenella mimigardefordensis]AHG66085.1 hypothetical protein MIM_c40340 [Advenella mimigardefordensis DPN7]
MPGKISIVCFTAVLAVASTQAHARDTRYDLPITQALTAPEAAGIVDPSIKMTFGRRGPGQVILADAVTNKKTSRVGKGSDEKACVWAFLSAYKQLQQRAKELGGTGVSNIVSYYKKNVNASTVNYECHAGAFVTGVALRGDIVR